MYYTIDEIAQKASEESTDGRVSRDAADADADADTDSPASTPTEPSATDGKIQQDNTHSPVNHTVNHSGDTHDTDQEPAASDESTAEDGKQVCEAVEDIADIDANQVVMCVHVEEDIHDPWFFGFSNGELYRYHPYFGYSGDRKLIEHRSSYAIMSEDIVTLAVPQAVLAAYQDGEGEIPQTVRHEVRKRQSRQHSSGTDRINGRGNRSRRGEDR